MAHLDWAPACTFWHGSLACNVFVDFPHSQICPSIFDAMVQGLERFRAALVVAHTTANQQTFPHETLTSKLSLSTHSYTNQISIISQKWHAFVSRAHSIPPHLFSCHPHLLLRLNLHAPLPAKRTPLSAKHPRSAVSDIIPTQTTNPRSWYRNYRPMRREHQNRGSEF